LCFPSTALSLHVLQKNGAKVHNKNASAILSCKNFEIIVSFNTFRMQKKAPDKLLDNHIIDTAKAALKGKCQVGVRYMFQQHLPVLNPFVYRGFGEYG
jgi:hypothetical protein